MQLTDAVGRVRPSDVEHGNATHGLGPHFQAVYTPWSIKKRATFIFSITLANINGFS